VRDDVHGRRYTFFIYRSLLRDNLSRSTLHTTYLRRNNRILPCRRREPDVRAHVIWTSWRFIIIPNVTPPQSRTFCNGHIRGCGLRFSPLARMPFSDAFLHHYIGRCCRFCLTYGGCMISSLYRLAISISCRRHRRARLPVGRQTSRTSARCNINAAWA